ncbi:TetR family transcriptional regulator [Jonesiaceae bacterium BS-20]|uniref:TetR family transcriptional regulator n=1 Tax=Jonesiaceae bacterium BS-20 TaxID=3120821 RepID=A0AAU7DX19_9MICO
MKSESGASNRAATPAPVRRVDPDRRNKIIDAALRVIATEGVAGTSHRKVAAAADVPLGSMTYHFTGMDELLHSAFSRFANNVAERFDKRMAQVLTQDDALLAVAANISDDIFAEQHDLTLTLELYTLAARNPAFRDITTQWMGRTRAALEEHFDPTTARLVDALIEGLTIHRALDLNPDNAPNPGKAIRRITTDLDH